MELAAIFLLSCIVTARLLEHKKMRVASAAILFDDHSGWISHTLTDLKELYPQVFDPVTQYVESNSSQSNDVTLTGDYAYDSVVEVAGGTVDDPLVLDLNGKTMNLADGSDLRIVSGVVTIQGGTINTNAGYISNSDAGLVVANGATLNLTDVEVVVTGESVFGFYNQRGATANISGCTFTTDSSIVDPNHGILSNFGTMMVKDSTFADSYRCYSSSYPAIYNCGNLTLENTTVNAEGICVATGYDYTLATRGHTIVIGGTFTSNMDVVLTAQTSAFHLDTSDLEFRKDTTGNAVVIKVPAGSESKAIRDYLDDSTITGAEGTDYIIANP